MLDDPIVDASLTARYSLLTAFTKQPPGRVRFSTKANQPSTSASGFANAVFLFIAGKMTVEWNSSTEDISKVLGYGFTTLSRINGA
jgi:hypothetical protein